MMATVAIIAIFSFAFGVCAGIFVYMLLELED